MLTTFKHDMLPTESYKWCCESQLFTWNKNCQNDGHGWESRDTFPHFWPKHLTHVLQAPHWHAKAWHSQMFPWFQKIKFLRWNKSIHWPSWHPYIKLIVQVLHQSIVENKNLSLVFYVILGQISFINCCVEVNFSLKFCLKISLLKNGASKK
jgi:hypothetical protein